MAVVDPEQIARIAKTIADLYGQATADLLRIVARRLARGIDRPGWAEQKLAETVAMRADAVRVVEWLTRELPEVTDDAIARAYRAGVSEAGRRVVIPEGVRALTETQVLRHQSTHLRILRWSDDVYRQVIADATLDVTGGFGTRRQAAQQALDRFATRGVVGYIDRAGRAWELETYAEMSARSTAGQAMVQGRLDRYQAEGRDLVIVSDAPQECSMCRPWEGKVLSLSGNAPGYPPLSRAVSDGLFHPNCRHDLRPYQPGVTKPYRHTQDPEGDRARQRLRAMERHVREWKRREAAAIDDDARARAQAKVRYWQGEIRAHTDATGVIRQRHREQVGRAR